MPAGMRWGHHPFGAVVARPCPVGASDGGAEGWFIPLVSRSEPDRKCLPIKAIFLPWSRGIVLLAIVVVRRRGRHPNGPRPALAGLGRARPVGPRDSTRPRPLQAAGRPRKLYEAQMHRSIVDEPQIMKEANLESFDVNGDLEIPGELARLALVIVSRHQKISFISVLWRAIDASSLS